MSDVIGIDVPRPVIGRPFPKGKSGNPGGRRKEVAKVQKALAKMHAKVSQKLEALLDSEEPALQIEGLKLWLKYMLPVPTEKSAVDVTVKGPTMSPSLAARLAALDVQ